MLDQKKVCKNTDSIYWLKLFFEFNYNINHTITCIAIKFIIFQLKVSENRSIEVTKLELVLKILTSNISS